MEKKLIYPVIIEEFNDEDGHYFTAEAPDIDGMITEGDTIADAAYWAEDAIATMLANEKKYPEPSDPREWKLTSAQKVVYVSVDMQAWFKYHSPTVQRTISIPQYLDILIKETGINASKISTAALEAKIDEIKAI
jgi:predicted RNase H-like HicB family nuclease